MTRRRSRPSPSCERVATLGAAIQALLDRPCDSDFERETVCSIALAFVAANHADPRASVLDRIVEGAVQLMDMRDGDDPWMAPLRAATPTEGSA